MKSYELTAAMLIILGVLALAYGGFTYTQETHETKIGPLSLSIEDRERVNIPIWAGAGAIVIGGLLFFLGRSPR